MKKKKYEAPAMQVFELKPRQSLLAASGTGNFEGLRRGNTWDLD